jgi:ADP-ribose pyrophosphatase YjhB (NUDIX family)
LSRDRRIEIIARGVFFEGDRVLLCRNLKHGYSFLPGGHVEFGEAADESLRREFAEECGVEIAVGDCLLVTEGVFESGSKIHHEINLVFHVERLDSGAIRSREAEIEFLWLGPRDLLSHDIRPGSVKDWLSRHAEKGLLAPTAAWASEIRL